MNWSELFFTLHKHCGLDKWKVMGYTLPQIAELMKSSNRYIRFEVETRMGANPLMGMMGGMGAAEGSSPSKQKFNDTEYQVATEDDIQLLAKALGG